MGVIIDTLGWQALAEGLAATGTYETIGAAVEAGAVAIEGAKAVGGFSVITGGAGATVTDFASALEVAQAAELAATATKVETASVTLAKTSGGFKLAGMATMTLPEVAAAAAPFAGVALGAELYRENPQLWTKISSTLLPFCYAENKIQAFVDFIQDPLTSEYSPIVTIPTAIIDALKGLFEDEGVSTIPTYDATDSLGRTVSGVSADSFYGKFLENFYSPSYSPFKKISGDSICYPGTEEIDMYVVGQSTWHSEGGHFDLTLSEGWHRYSPSWGIGTNPYNPEDVLRDPSVDIKEIPATAGVSAPTAPVEPIVWPDTPIIVVPDPLGPDYQPIPVTPIVPMLPPYEPPLPLPEHVPDPTPEAPPEGWPEEDPWPTVVPFPVQPTEPDPDWPEVMPWPLPPENPEEWPLSPEVPKKWPEEFPPTEPWPHSPEEWPEEVPWPDHPPEDWPDGTPWPESPENWPDEVPWPVPWPEEWPDTEPWPIKWPDEVPYPWPFPYPSDPSPDPYPDPREIPDPDDRVGPIIDPWPWPLPDPRTDPEPNPRDDPSQPEPRPEPKPDGPLDPPPPPSGKIEPAPPPIIPLPFSSTTGLISVYHPTQSELLNFCSWLWVTWQDATIDKIWNNPFDGIITLFELYCTPTDVGRKNIRSGFLDSGVSSETISRYTEIDCGSIGVPEYFGNYFDYSPYSKCHIYLPFIGIVELNVDDIVGHGVNVTYRIDEYNGSCIAMITVAKSTTVNEEEVEYSNIMYQFSGNCAVDLPIAGGSQAAIKAGMLEAAAWGLGSVIGGIMGGESPMSIGADIAQGAANAVHSLVSAKSSVQHSGSFGSSFGALGNKKPFIIVTRPKQIQVPNYQVLYGYPAHKMVIIGDCTGYLRCREVHVISPTASDEEKTLIEALLKEGVYISE